MTKILIPVDGSEASRRAVNWVIGRIQAGSPLDVELLNIQPEIVSGHARAFLSRDDIQAYMKDEIERLASEPIDDALFAAIEAHVGTNGVDLDKIILQADLDADRR